MIGQHEKYITYDLISQTPKDCSILAMATALDRPYEDILDILNETGAYNPIDGTKASAVREILLVAGWKQIIVTNDERAYRRTPAFKPEHMPATPALFVMKHHATYWDGAKLHETWDSFAHERSRIYTYFVPADSEETVGKFWDRVDAARLAKYGRDWHVTDFDKYYIKYGRRKA